MLNTFPLFLSLSFFAPLILRLILAIVLFWIILKILRNKDAPMHPITMRHTPIFSGLVLGLLMIVGIYTQITAILVVLYVIIAMVYESINNKRDSQMVIYILLLSISISLLTTGAGAFAFDLPL